MSEITLVSPLLDGYKLLEQFSEHDGTQCCYLEKIETGEQFVLKHISIPESETKTQALILTGAVADEASANEYYEGLAEDLRSELIRMQAFREHGGIAAWTDFQIEPREGIGFDVYMLMPRKQSLKTYLQDNAITQLQALNLGIDLCDALNTLREAGFTYQNLKPENVFISENNRFSIGDLGLIPCKDLEFSAVPESYVNHFSAPELSKLIPEPNETSDLYALGMILYYIFNGNHLPFEDEKTPPDKAAAKRLESQLLPAPVYADYELAEIISVACSSDSTERYDSPAAFRQALTLYMQRNEVSDQLLVPPLIAEAPAQPPESPAADGAAVPDALPDSAAETPDTETAGTPEAPAPNPPPSEEAPPDTALPEENEPAPADPDDSEKKDSETSPTQPDDEEPAPEEIEESPPESIDELLASVNDVLGEEDTAIEAPDIEANEEELRDSSPKKKKKRVWIPLLIALLILALLGAAIAYFYTNWYLVTMERIEVVDRSFDSVTVAYQLSSPDPDLSWECIDTYGNSYAGTSGEEQLHFHDLEPGTQYTIRFFPGKLHKLLGETTVSAATVATTQVVSMTAAQGPDKTTAEIALVVSGPEPDQWLLTYTSTGSDSGSMRFSGHTVEIPGLKLNDTYSFELQAMEDFYLSGQTACELKMVPDVQIDNFRVSSATSDSLTVSWESLADSPLSWTVRCFGGSYDETLEVKECVATFRGVKLDQSYTFSLTTPDGASPLSITLPANAKIITSLNAEEMDAGSVKVNWTCTDPQPEKGWVVRYQIGSSSASAEVPEGNEVLLTGLPANSEINITLEPAGGDSVIGMRSCTAQTPDAVTFTNHEFKTDDSDLTLYTKPSGQDWSFDDLDESVEEFDPDEEIALVLQAPEEFRSQDTEETSITLVIRNADGAVAAYRTVSSTWNDIWRDGKYLANLRLPNTPGKYQAELYFDSQFVSSHVFNVRGGEVG